MDGQSFFRKQAKFSMRILRSSMPNEHSDWYATCGNMVVVSVKWYMVCEMSHICPMGVQKGQTMLAE